MNFCTILRRMLQRIQSVYLLLAILCLGAMFFFPIAQGGEVLFDTEGVHAIVSDGASTVQSIKSILPFQIGFIVIGLIGLLVFTILQYRHRGRQMIFCRIGYLLILGLVVLIYMTIADVMKQTGMAEAAVKYDVSTYLPVVALVFLFLANRAIRKDEEMVKSLDRLR